MVCIYLIEDINDLKYVGSTKQKLNVRLNSHKSDKRRGKSVSSSKLNLYNCIITELETCNEENRKEREQYYIDTIDCVNCYNTYFDEKQWSKEYYHNNKDKIKEHGKEYRENNKEKHKEHMKQYYHNNKEKIKEYHKEYNKLDWYCSDCKCNLKLHNKSYHLQSQKHQLNTNNYLIET
jgi:hypothetical protein